jgi:hypothetical protein
VLLLQHPVLVLVFKEKLCHSLAWWLGSVFFLLSFSSSCLVSISLSEVWQFKFICCPQVPEISSVAHQLSCFGVGFSVCWFTGGLFICLTPFLWVKVSDHQPAPCFQLAVNDGLLIVFKFCIVVWLWMLLSGSVDELCGVIPALFLAAAYHQPTVGPPAFPAFVYWMFAWRSVPCSSPLFWCTSSIPITSAVC